MCAMMPMFRVFSNAVVRGILLLLPAVMRERLVGFRHAVSVFLLLDGISSVVVRVDQFTSELFFHGLFAPRSRIRQYPADCQRRSARRIDFDRYLVRRTANTARLHFQDGLDVLDSFLEKLERVILSF